MKNTPILEISDLNLSIASMKILKGVSLTIQSGETVGVIGPNGSGKTTLLNCLSGFLDLSSGNIVFNGQQITKEPPFKRAKIGVGRVFQNFGIFRDMTLIENIVTALEGKQSFISGFLPWSKQTKENKRLALEYLAEAKLQGKANDRAGTLSGGQMRLLEIIRTFAFGAELFILDEPTAGVSPKMKQEVADLIIKLKNLGKTIIIVEHDINFIKLLCNRVIVLDEGKVVLDGDPKAVQSDPRLQEIYFGSVAS